MAELHVQLMKDAKFTEGFSNWRIKWCLSTLIKQCDKNRLESFFETPIRYPKAETDTDFWWDLVIDTSGSGESLWIGLTLKTDVKIPAPIIYRMVIVDEQASIRFQWSDFFVFLPSFSPASWKSFSNSDATTLMKEGDRFTLHLFISIPIGICDMDKFRQPFAVETVLRKETPKKDGFREKFVDLLETILAKDDDSGFNDDDSEYSSDITIDIVNGDKSAPLRQFHCHRMMLMLTHSPFFTKKIGRRRNPSRSSLAPITEDNEVLDIIKISVNDADAETMELILRYIYTGRMPEMDDDDRDDEGRGNKRAIKLAKAASVFEFHDLKSYCEAQLIFKYTTDNDRIDQIILADKINSVQLKTVCLEQLATYALFKDLKQLATFALFKKIDLAAECIFPKEMSDETQLEIMKAAQSKIFIIKTVEPDEMKARIVDFCVFNQHQTD